MIYIRGHRTDFDGWSEKGCSGWDSDAVLPYFVKAESNSRLEAVDPELQVRGVDNLRVIDASVMPSIIGGNTNATTIMIGEKGADLVQAKRSGK